MRRLHKTKGLFFCILDSLPERAPSSKKGRSPFVSVAIDSALVYLGKNGSPLVRAVVGGIGDGMLV